MKEKDLNTYANEETAPAWLVEALQLAKDWQEDWEEFQQPLEEPIPAAFQARLAVTTEAALSLARLRREREQRGFMPMSLEPYLGELAKQANVSLPFVLERFGLSRLATAGVESAEALVRLAKTLGLELRELLAHLRLGVVVEHQLAPLAMVARRQFPGGWRNPPQRPSPLEECEEYLDWLEQHTDRQHWAEVRRLIIAVKSAWDDEAGSDELVGHTARPKEP